MNDILNTSIQVIDNKNILETRDSALTFQASQLEITLISNDEVSSHIVPVNPNDIRLVTCFGDSILTGLCMDAGHPKSVKRKFMQWIQKHKFKPFYPWLTWMISKEHRQYTCITGSKIESIANHLQSMYPEHQQILNKKSTWIWSKGDRFNFAKSGICLNGLEAQIQRFLRKLNQPLFSHYKNEWKLCVIWVGSNDIIRFKDSYLKKEFEYRLTECLYLLQRVLPKCFVVLVEIPQFGLAKLGDVFNQKHYTSWNKKSKRFFKNKDDEKDGDGSNKKKNKRRRKRKGTCDCDDLQEEYGVVGSYDFGLHAGDEEDELEQADIKKEEKIDRYEIENGEKNNIKLDHQAVWEKKIQLVNDILYKVTVDMNKQNFEDFNLKLIKIPNSLEGDVVNFNNDIKNTEMNNSFGNYNMEKGEFISIVDGIHPSMLAHQFFSKMIWNGIFGENYPW